MKKNFFSRNGLKGMLLVMVTTVIVCTCIISNVANANNWTDTEYEFYFNAGKTKTYVASSGRKKEDDSKAYISCNYAYEPNIAGTLKFTAQTHGSNKKGSGFTACKYKGKSTPTYTIKKGDAKYLTNFVKETNKKYANIQVKKNGVAATFRGNWSPDNYNGY